MDLSCSLGPATVATLTELLLWLTRLDSQSPWLSHTYNPLCQRVQSNFGIIDWLRRSGRSTRLENGTETRDSFAAAMPWMRMA
mmetsp:Transcript_8312/g.23608  ORF Transcript_8312/g.23608 Transcript_8312/m.23608 type:complete len:83 (-) Transcript_8312:103-351(-)